MSKIGKSMEGHTIRATSVDGCGRVIYGEASQGVSDGFISVAWTANTVDTAEISQENARGQRCIYRRAKTSLTGYSVTITFCEVDPELFSLITGQRVILDANGNAVGFAINTDVDLGERGFALEVWTGSPPSEDGCTNPNAQGRWGYFLAPFLKGGLLGDYSVENGAINFTIQGATTEGGNAWGVGPYAVTLNAANQPGPLLEALLPNDHKQLIWVEVAPPEAFVGTRPVLDPTSTAISAIVVAEGGSPTEADLTFTGATADPVWVDFGDGTWDYVADATQGASHVYAANGTYVVRASTNGLTWVTSTAEIPFP
ncbi:major tail protein [Microbacterium phage Fizzles]|nr:major tail protein [Microbacterium phage Fizzles]